MNKKLIFGYFFAIGLSLSAIFLGFNLFSSESIRRFFAYGEKLHFFSFFAFINANFLSLFFAVFSAVFIYLLVFKPRWGIILGLFLPVLNIVLLFTIRESALLFIFYVFYSFIYWLTSVLIVLFLTKIYKRVNYFYKKIIIVAPLCILIPLAVVVFARYPLNLSQIAKVLNNSKLCSFAGNDIVQCYNALGIETKNHSLCVETNSPLYNSCFDVTEISSFGNIDEIKVNHMKKLYDKYLASQGRIGKNYTARVPRNEYEYFLYRNDKKYKGDILVGNDGKDDFIYCYNITAGDPDGIINCMKSIKPLVVDKFQLTKLYQDYDILNLRWLNYDIDIFNRLHNK